MPPNCLVSRDQVFHIVPVLHYRVEFAELVRQVFEEIQPQRLAVELPSFLSESYLRAVGRFPRLSVISYEAGESTMILPVEPSDPFAEAVRSASEGKIPVHFLDLHVEGYELHNDRVPDSAALTAVGFEAWWKEWENTGRRSLDPVDHEREAYMVQELLQLRKFYPEQKFMVVCGAMHALNLLAALNQEDEPPLRIFKEVGAPTQVTLAQPDVESARALSIEIPLASVLYELRRGGEGPPETWQAAVEDEPEPPQETTPLAELSKDEVFDSISALLGLKKRPKERVFKQSTLRQVQKYLLGLQQKPMAFSELIEQMMTAQTSDQIHLPSAPPPPRVKAFTFRHVEQRRSELLAIYQGMLEDAGQPLDRQRLLVSGVEHAARFYHENTGETIVRWQKQTLFQFLRNYAAIKGRLLPTWYEMVMGARGVADDNFAYEMWDFFTFYPWSDDEAKDAEPLHFDDDALILGNRKLRRWSLHRKLPQLRQLKRVLPNKRASEDKAGEWSEDFERGSLCSYPPEDLVIEDYGRYLQKKAISMLSLEKTRVEPFTTSILDGIDMRETLRNWHERKIFVQEAQRIQGGVGAVVIIFDLDLDDKRYPWKMTWHGENAQESDMAFYATPVRDKIVGPGIARCEYGGLMLSYPNRRLSDVWNDPYYSHCQNKAEVLLMASLEYSMERHVVYVAAQPPRSLFKSLAGRLGRKIVYIPIGQLSPQSLKKIRVFHALSGHKMRKIAKDYIW